jgi:hypothetical protein
MLFIIFGFSVSKDGIKNGCGRIPFFSMLIAIA